MHTINVPPHKEAIISEYANVRSELVQLNGQIYSILTGSLALNVTILGWMFSKNDPSKYLYLPTIGVLVLFTACLLILNRNRLAHRLAIFQTVFIETRIPDICWGRVYFQYRDQYEKKGSWLVSWSERLVESGVNTLLIIEAINLGIFIIYAALPWFTEGTTQADPLKLANLLIIIVVIIIQVLVQGTMTNYQHIHDAMEKTFNRSSLGEK